MVALSCPRDISLWLSFNDKIYDWLPWLARETSVSGSRGSSQTENVQPFLHPLVLKHFIVMAMMLAVMILGMMIMTTIAMMIMTTAMMMIMTTVMMMIMTIAMMMMMMIMTTEMMMMMIVTRAMMRTASVFSGALLTASRHHMAAGSTLYPTHYSQHFI